MTSVHFKVDCVLQIVMNYNTIYIQGDLSQRIFSLIKSVIIKLVLDNKKKPVRGAPW